MCFRILVLLYFAIKETPQHYNSTATVSVQDSSPRSEFGVVVVFVLSSCEVLENTGKAKVSMNFKNVQKSNQTFFSDSKAEMLSFIENFVAVSSFRFELHCLPLKDKI